jgi:hypothetical protein
MVKYGHLIRAETGKEFFNPGVPGGDGYSGKKRQNQPVHEKVLLLYCAKNERVRKFLYAVFYGLLIR